MRRNLIDIHNHSLCGVDDGAEHMQESLAMLKDAHRQGIEAIVLTPHYRHGMFAYEKKEIEKQYDALRKAAEAMGMGVCLGCEYHVNSEVVHAFQTGRCHSLADGDYVLTEYSYQTEYSYIQQYTQQLLACGYIPVIAHVERYGCIQKKSKLCAELSAMGAWIQVNADSVLGMEGRAMKHVSRKLLKSGLADVIASDAHDIKHRPNRMRQCYEYVAQKYGEKYADTLFYWNPRKIIEDAQNQIY